MQQQMQRNSSLSPSVHSNFSMRQESQNLFKHPGPLYRSPQQKQTQNQEKIEMHHNDRMALLHTRLQQEAEKIRKWKNTMELEMEQKTSQLTEAQLVVEKQQKSLIDVQLKNETLNSRIEEEMANQKEIQLKIHSTREMCVALKEHVHHVERAVESGENDRITLLELNKELNKKYEDLLEKFHLMEKKQLEFYDSMKQEIEHEKQLNIEVTAQLNELSITSDEQIKALESELKISKEKCTSFEYTLNVKVEEMNNLVMEKGNLEGILIKKEEQLETAHSELLQLMNSLKEKESEIKDLHGQIDELNKTIEEQGLKLDKEKEESLEQTKSHISRVNELTQQLEQAERENNQLNHKLELTTDELIVIKEEKLQCIEKCDGLNIELKEIKENEKCLTNDLMTMKDQHHTLEEAHSNLLKECSTCKEKMTELECSLVRMTKEKSGIKETLTEIINVKNDEMAKMDIKVSNLEMTISTLTRDNDASSNEVKSKEQSLLELEGKVKTLELELASIKKEKDNADNEMESVRQHLKEKDKLSQALNQKITELQQETEKQSQLVELSNQKAARLEAEIDVCQNALASCKQELSRAISTNERDVKNIKEVTKRFMLEKNELSERINKLMKEGEELKRKEVDARQALDVHAKEIGVTLERYKAENELIVKHKDKEIEALTDKGQKEAKEKELLKKRIAELEETYEARDKRISNELEQSNDQIDNLKRQLQEKETELTQLVLAASTLKAAQSSICKAPSTQKMTTPAQTTPKRSPFDTPVRKIPQTPTPHPRKPLSVKCMNEIEPSTIEKRMFKELYGEKEATEKENFKKPKMKTGGDSGRSNVRGSGSAERRYSRVTDKGKSAKSKSKTRERENLTWFDNDPVFGFQD